MAQHTSYDRDKQDDNPVDKATEDTKRTASAVAEETKQQASQVTADAKAKASRVADEAQTEAKKVAEEAKQKASDVSAEAKQTAGVVAAEAKQEGQKVVEQATTQASELMDDAQKQASAFFSQYLEQWTTQASGFSNALRQTGQNLREQDQGNQFAGYADTIADQLEGFSNSVRSGNLNQLMQDAEDFARREPAMFVGGALVAGVAIARFLKSSSPTGRARSGSGARPYAPDWPSSGGQRVGHMERSGTIGASPLAGQGYYRDSTLSMSSGSLPREGDSRMDTYDVSRDPRVGEREASDTGRTGIPTDTAETRQQRPPSGFSVPRDHSADQEGR